MLKPQYIYVVIATLCSLYGAPCVAAEGLQATRNKNIDFSGAWEKDFSKSDDIQQQLRGLVRDIRRVAERRAKAGMDRGPGAGLVVGDNTKDSVPSIIGLAKMADLVTQSQVLEIEHSRAAVTIKRESAFALGCTFHDGESVAVENPLGREICGWDEHQLVFNLYLPEGLTIQHRLTLGPAGRRLNVATTVLSDQVSRPFTINRVYNRFEPGSQGIRCEHTITRGKVCTTVSY